MATIFAQATAPGRAGVAVIRISGPDAWGVAANLMNGVPEGRGLRAIRDQTGVIDRALVLSFRGPDSFTGEDTVELHLHGSRAVVAAVLGALGQTTARAAEAGEFTRRALENGKLDLAQVEGLADLIDAETESQRKQALRVFEGGLGALAETWRARLIRAAALVEATIDFVDEEVPVDVYPEVRALLEETAAELNRESAGSHIAERIRDGFEVAIVGAPNVGKSTLLNRLAGREAAITSAYAGTTRDVIEVRMDLDGLPVTLLDTAGIRQTTDNIEEIGIERALARAKSADLRVFLQEPGENPPMAPEPDDIAVIGKADLRPDVENAVSGQDGRGVDQLVQRIGSVLHQRASGAGVAIRERHRVAMQQAHTHLLESLDMIARMIEPDLIADEIRMATRAVDIIVGRVGVDDLLDEIFQSFCIGK